MQTQARPIQQVNVKRPSRYTIGPEFVAEVGESEISRFRMRIDALSADEQRMSFSWRSPGLSLICSSNCFLETSWKIRAPAAMSFASMSGPLVQLIDGSAIPTAAGASVAETHRLGSAAKIVFSGGDGFGKALTNYQLTVNGASVSNSRMNEYKSTVDRVWFDDEVCQKRFYRCGGIPQQNDSVPISGHSYNGAVAGGAGIAAFSPGGVLGNANYQGSNFGIVSGYTGDSGIAKRAENLLACTQVLADPTVPLVRDERIIRVRWPVSSCGVFSPLAPFDNCSESCPYRQSCIAIPNMNVCTLELLFKDLKEQLFRNLMAAQGDGAAAGTIALGTTSGGFEIELLTDEAPKLHVEYLRLPSYRAIPAKVDLTVFRAAVHDITSKTEIGTVAIPDAATRTGKGVLADTIVCRGVSRGDGTRRNASFRVESSKECLWSGVTVAQCPQFLAFLLQKSSDQFVLGGTPADDARGRRINNWQTLAAGAVDAARTSAGGLSNMFLSRNTDASASILEFDLEISSSIGSYKYSGEKYPFSRQRDELFRDVQRYAVDTYCKGDINKWKKHCGIIYLGADAFIRGLATFGSSFPLVINAKVKFGCEREYIDGTGAASKIASPGAAVQRDFIYGKPIMICQYNKNSLTVSPSSAILSSQNMSHASAMAQIAGGRS